MVVRRLRRRVLFAEFSDVLKAGCVGSTWCREMWLDETYLRDLHELALQVLVVRDEQRSFLAELLNRLRIFGDLGLKQARFLVDCGITCPFVSLAYQT